jgi:hypothetical protein
MTIYHNQLIPWSKSLWNPEVHYHVQKSHLLQCHQSGLFPSGSLTKILYAFLNPSHACYAPFMGAAGIFSRGQPEN